MRVCPVVSSRLRRRRQGLCPFSSLSALSHSHAGALGWRVRTRPHVQSVTLPRSHAGVHAGVPGGGAHKAIADHCVHGPTRARADRCFRQGCAQSHRGPLRAWPYARVRLQVLQAGFWTLSHCGPLRAWPDTRACLQVLQAGFWTLSHRGPLRAWPDTRARLQVLQVEDDGQLSDSSAEDDCAYRNMYNYGPGAAQQGQGRPPVHASSQSGTPSPSGAAGRVRRGWQVLYIGGGLSRGKQANQAAGRSWAGRRWRWANWGRREGCAPHPLYI